MAHTTESSFSNGDKPDPSAMTLVYEGSITWDGSGWHNISFTTPFSYDNVNNLLIYYENRDGSCATYDYPIWYYTGEFNRVAYKNRDHSFPETAGCTSWYVPNIRMYYATGPKTLSSLTGVQASTEIVQPGYENNAVLRLDFEVTGLTGTLNLTEINVTSKNTDDSDIAANGVKAYVT